jgi:hypothetical protein
MQKQGKISTKNQQVS